MPHLELDQNQASARRSMISTVISMAERRGVVALMSLSVALLLVVSAVYMGRGRVDAEASFAEAGVSEGAKQAAANRLRMWWNRVNQMQTEMKDMRSQVDQVLLHAAAQDSYAASLKQSALSAHSPTHGVVKTDIFFFMASVEVWWRRFHSRSEWAQQHRHLSSCLHDIAAHAWCTQTTDAVCSHPSISWHDFKSFKNQKFACRKSRAGWINCNQRQWRYQKMKRTQRKEQQRQKTRRRRQQQQREWKRLQKRTLPCGVMVRAHLGHSIGGNSAIHLSYAVSDRWPWW